MTGIAIYRSGTIICVASNTLFMKCIGPGQQEFITGFLMARAAVVLIIIHKVMVTVQTVQKICVCVGLVGEKNFAGIILKHQSDWVGRGCR